MLLGFDSTFKTDETFWDKAEDLAGDYIIQREIVKAVNGKPFFINDEETKKPVRLLGLTNEEFYHYYSIWEDFHVLKVLPHGQGTLKERRWVIDLIKAFERAYKEVEIFVESKNSK